MYVQVIFFCTMFVFHVLVNEYSCNFVLRTIELNAIEYITHYFHIGFCELFVLGDIEYVENHSQDLLQVIR